MSEDELNLCLQQISMVIVEIRARREQKGPKRVRETQKDRLAKVRKALESLSGKIDSYIEKKLEDGNDRPRREERRNGTFHT